MNIGPMEITIVLILALLVFGPKRLPQAGRSLGQAIRELKKATSAARSDLGLDDVAADVRDLKSSLSIDLKAADQPASAQPGGAVAPAAVIDVLPALSGAAETTEDTAASGDAGGAGAEVTTAEAPEAGAMNTPAVMNEPGVEVTTAGATDEADAVAEAEATDEADASSGPNAPAAPFARSDA